MIEWQLETGNTIRNSSSSTSSVNKVAAACLKRANEMLNEMYAELLEKMNHFF